MMWQYEAADVATPAGPGTLASGRPVAVTGGVDRCVLCALLILCPGRARPGGTHAEDR